MKAWLERRRYPAGRDVQRTIKAFQHLQTIKADLLEIPTQAKVLFAGIGNEEYQRARSESFFYNDCGYPSAIFFPRTGEECAIIIAHLSKIQHKTRVYVSGGRHSHFSYVDASVTVDLKEICQVVPNLENKYVDVGGGAKLGSVDQALANTGFGIVTGTNPDTGVGGLTLAGGWGFLARQHGFACDNLIEAEVVLANGKLVVARDDNEYATLMQALRGGGGEFGAVTRFRFELFPASTCIYGYTARVVPGKANAIANLKHWRDTKLPNTVSSQFALPCGAPICITLGVDMNADAKRFEDSPALVKLTQESKGHWLTLNNKFKVGSFHTGAQKMLEAMMHRGHYLTTAHMVGKLTDEMVEQIIHFTRTDVACKGAIVILVTFGGEMPKEKRPSSIRYRDAEYWILIEAKYPGNASAKQIQLVREWIDRFKAALVRTDVGQGIAQPAHGFYDSQVKARQFLEEARKQYDPTGFFKLDFVQGAPTVPATGVGAVATQ